MSSICRYGCLIVLVAITSLAQEEGRASGSSHAQLNASNSYVLVLNKEAIVRGPDFSQRVIALQNGKKQHFRDFVWFSTQEGCFLVADTDSIQRLRDFEKTQKVLNKRWERDATNPALVRQLRHDQDEHTARRDEFIWTLFDDLKQQGRLASTKGDCSAH